MESISYPQSQLLCLEKNLINEHFINQNYEEITNKKV